MAVRRLAVLATCHNRRQMTLEALAAVYRQRLPEDFVLTVFLVDADSTDGTREAVARAFPECRVIRTDASVFWNRGMHRAFATALDEDFDFYLWLNDDTSLYADALLRLLEAFAERSQAGERCCILVGTTVDPCTGEPTYGGVVRASRWHPFRFRRVDPSDDMQRVDTMNGNCVLIPREVARLAGNLEPTFSHTFGDFDYGLRASRLGCTVWVVPGVVGTCARNPIAGTWQDRSLPLRARLRKVLSPKGIPPREWLVFTRRHGGRLWPIYWVAPYVKLILNAMW